MACLRNSGLRSNIWAHSYLQTGTGPKILEKKAATKGSEMILANFSTILKVPFNKYFFPVKGVTLVVKVSEMTVVYKNYL